MDIQVNPHSICLIVPDQYGPIKRLQLESVVKAHFNLMKESTFTYAELAQAIAQKCYGPEAQHARRVLLQAAEDMED